LRENEDAIKPVILGWLMDELTDVIRDAGDPDDVGAIERVICDRRRQ
jgi:hypothetical protein